MQLVVNTISTKFCVVGMYPHHSIPVPSCPLLPRLGLKVAGGLDRGSPPKGHPLPILTLRPLCLDLAGFLDMVKLPVVPIVTTVPGWHCWDYRAASQLDVYEVEPPPDLRAEVS
eukprot:g46839.t1